MPGLSATVGEQIDALRRMAGEKAVKLIRHEPDEMIMGMVAGWAPVLRPSARALGFVAETSFDEIIRVHIEDEMGQALTRKIAFLGTGLMGTPMATRLLDAGLDVTVWNRDSAKAVPLVEKGAKLAKTAAEAAENADVVITMLTDGPAVRDVLLSKGSKGFEQGLRGYRHEFDFARLRTGTCRASQSRRRRSRGRSSFRRCRRGSARHSCDHGRGDEEVVARLADVFKPMGRLTRVGPSGAGQLAKLANQQIVAVTIGAIAEAMVLVERGGGSRAAFRDAIRGGFCESRILELHGKRMIDRNFQPGGKSRIQLKDLDAILKAAGDLSLNLPLTETVREAFAAFVGEGGGDADHSALLLHIEKLNEGRKI